MNDFNVQQKKWNEIRKVTTRPVWAAQMKTWQGGQFSKAAESIVAMQKAAAQQVWSVQMKGTAFSKVTEALAFQKFTASVYNEKHRTPCTSSRGDRTRGH